MLQRDQWISLFWQCFEFSLYNLSHNSLDMLASFPSYNEYSFVEISSMENYVKK